MLGQETNNEVVNLLLFYFSFLGIMFSIFFSLIYCLNKCTRSRLVSKASPTSKIKAIEKAGISQKQKAVFSTLSPIKEVTELAVVSEDKIVHTHSTNDQSFSSKSVKNDDNKHNSSFDNPFTERVDMEAADDGLAFAEVAGQIDWSRNEKRY